MASDGGLQCNMNKYVGSINEEVCFKCNTWGGPSRLWITFVQSCLVYVGADLSLKRERATSAYRTPSWGKQILVTGRLSKVQLKSSGEFDQYSLSCFR